MFAAAPAAPPDKWLFDFSRERESNVRSGRVRKTPDRRSKQLGSVPTNANTCAPTRTAAMITVGSRAHRGGTIVCTAPVRAPMDTTIDASNAPWCQWPPNSGVRSIKGQRGRFRGNEPRVALHKRVQRQRLSQPHLTFSSLLLLHGSPSRC